MPAQFNTLCQIPHLHLAWNIVKAKGAAGGISIDNLPPAIIDLKDGFDFLGIKCADNWKNSL